MTQSELKQKYVDILKTEVFPHNEEMIEYCISTCVHIVALSDERIAVVTHERKWAGEISFFKGLVEHLQDCLEGKRKAVAMVQYITAPADSKLVREVIYIPNERPDWIRAENKRISKLTKEDIKALIAGYQTVIDKYQH